MCDLRRGTLKSGDIDLGVDFNFYDEAFVVEDSKCLQLPEYLKVHRPVLLTRVKKNPTSLTLVRLIRFDFGPRLLRADKGLRIGWLCRRERRQRSTSLHCVQITLLECF